MESSDNFNSVWISVWYVQNNAKLSQSKMVMNDEIALFTLTEAAQFIEILSRMQFGYM